MKVDIWACKIKVDSPSIYFMCPWRCSSIHTRTAKASKWNVGSLRRVFPSSLPAGTAAQCSLSPTLRILCWDLPPDMTVLQCMVVPLRPHSLQIKTERPSSYPLNGKTTRIGFKRLLWMFFLFICTFIMRSFSLSCYCHFRSLTTFTLVYWFPLCFCFSFVICDACNTLIM